MANLIQILMIGGGWCCGDVVAVVVTTTSNLKYFSCLRVLKTLTMIDMYMKGISCIVPVRTWIPNKA